MATSKHSPSHAISRVSTVRRAAALLGLAVLATVYLFPKPMNWLVVNTGSLLGLDWTDKQSNRSFVLGLDLQGGSRLEYEADLSKVAVADRPEAMNGVRDVIERRVNSMGVSEPLVQTTQAGDSWRVNVELAGVNNVQDAIKRIGETPILEFKEEDPSAGRALTAEEQARITEDQATQLSRAETLLDAVEKPGADFSALVRAAVSGTYQAPALLRANASEAELYKLLRTREVGLVGGVIDTPEAYYLAKILEKKEVTKEATGRHLLITWEMAGDSATEEAKAASASAKLAARSRIDALKAQATPQNLEALVREHSMEPNASSTGGVLEWIDEVPAHENAPELVAEFAKPFFASAKNVISDVVESPFGFHIFMKTDERPAYDVRAEYVKFERLTAADILPASDGWKASALTGKQLESARVDFDQQTGGIYVALQFNPEGADLFADLTRRNVGKRVAIFVDGVIISSPVVEGEIPGGQAIINGLGSLEEARTLARNLQAGALPVPIELIAKQTIGPSLGAESVAASLKAGLVGFAFVALFMLLVYRVPGLVAVASLALYAVLSLAVFKYLPVTLTLSGIAGFILSLGIAVDANVLVFERLKEELQLGKSLPLALEEAFTRAWPSVRDGHVTVLISCAVLYWFSSSIIRGFSLTLAIGIGISLFTAVVTCRVWLRYLAATPIARWKWGFLDTTHRH